MGYPITSDGKRICSVWPTEGTRRTIITSNWCDPTGWYQKAVRVVDETASGSDVTWNLAHQNVIDTAHGKLTDEDFLKDADGNAYRVVVKVDGVTKTEHSPGTTDGDYGIDYAAGTLTFLAPPAVAPLVTYHYANGSEFVIKPLPGKVLKIVHAEVQFSADIVITDTIDFQPYGLVEVFAPQLTPDPYPAGTLLPLGDPVRYKTMMDYINEANHALPQIPALGGPGWRGSPAINVFPWNYQAVTNLESSSGLEIRIRLLNDVPFGGSVATATFYCLSVNE